MRMSSSPSRLESEASGQLSTERSFAASSEACSWPERECSLKTCQSHAGGMNAWHHERTGPKLSQAQSEQCLEERMLMLLELEWTGAVLALSLEGCMCNSFALVLVALLIS